MNPFQAIPAHSKLGKLQPNNKFVLDWVHKTNALVQPENIFWCDGSEEEKAFLTEQAVKQGVLIPLDPKKWPGCHYHHSNPNEPGWNSALIFAPEDRKRLGRPITGWNPRPCGKNWMGSFREP